MSTECNAVKSSPILESIIAQLNMLSSFGSITTRFELPLVEETDSLSQFRCLANAYKDQGNLGAAFLRRLSFELSEDKVYGTVFKGSRCEEMAAYIVQMLNDGSLLCIKFNKNAFDDPEWLERAREKCFTILERFETIGRKSAELAIVLTNLYNTEPLSEHS